MNYDREEHIGKLLDEALQEHLDLYFQPAWHPQETERKLRAKRRRWGWWSGSVAAAAVVFALPFAVQLPSGHGLAVNRDLSAAALPNSLRKQLNHIAKGPFNVNGMVPVYETYPMATPTAHTLTVSGQFNIAGTTGDTVSLTVNNHRQLEGGVMFDQGSPVYQFSGASIQSGTVIAPSGPATKAHYSIGYIGATGINTFSAPGPHVYVTHNNLWSDLYSNVPVAYWRKSPGSPPANRLDSIAGLPSNPNDALLTEEDPSGISQGFITHNGGTTWHAWSLGPQSITNLIAIGNRYWAILNGTLAWSSNGQQWNNVLPLNTNRWQVETYAIDPVNPNILAVSLIPISGDGIGPILETQNGGQSWSEVPNFPSSGSGPTTMVMNSTGDISALINANGPVVVRYSAGSQQWSIFPVPTQANSSGLGQLAATADGDLIYGAPGGDVYEWKKSTNQWLVMPPPKGYDPSGAAAAPLQAIGSDQILVGYPTDWVILVNPSAPSSPTNNTAAAAPTHSKVKANP